MNTVDRTRLGRASAALSIGIGVVALLVQVVEGTLGLIDEGNFSLHFSVVAVGFGALVWVALPSQPGNGVLWALAGSALSAAIALIGIVLIVVFAPDDVSSYRELAGRSPSELPRAAGVGAMLAGGTWVTSLFLVIGVGLPLFPDGKPPSPRWRWLVWFNLVTIFAITLGLTLASNPNSTTPMETSGEDFDGVAGAIVEQLFFPLVVGAVLAIASLVVRYRRSSGATRPQIRWIALGGLTFLIGAIVAEPDAVLWPLLAGELLLITAFVISITRYRLYDIDVIVSKSVTYLGLAAAITILYAAVVVVPLVVIGESDSDGGPGLLLPIVATAIVAVLFEPIRSRMQRWANRLVYGNRSTPHEVLSTVTARLAEAAAGSGTNDLALLLAEGTAADRAVVWLQTGNTLHPEGIWPPADLINPIQVTALVDSETTESRAVRHGKQQFGALTITKPPSDPITPADRQLLSDVAAGAGLLLRNISLNRLLEERAHQLRESRRRLIAAQDTERHRLERDLHDGAQQQVVALKVKLSIARTIAEREQADEIASRIASLAQETQEAVEALRAVAHGIYPPLLESEGLEPALRATQRSTNTDLTIETNGLVRYSREVEETAYFCLVGAINQATDAGATTVTVSLTGSPGLVAYTVRHDAVVDDLTAVSDRIDAFGGTLTIESGSGTSTVAVRLPDPTTAPIGIGSGQATSTVSSQAGRLPTEAIPS